MEKNMQKYLEKLQKLFRLQDWDIELTEESTLNCEGASLAVYNDYKATITLNKKLSKEEKKQTLIHELLHLINRDSCDIATDNIDNEYAKKLYTRTHERAIEKQAQIIYKLMK